MQFNQPTGVAATAAHVWVTDRNNHRVVCFDAASGALSAERQTIAAQHVESPFALFAK